MWWWMVNGEAFGYQNKPYHEMRLDTFITTTISMDNPWQTAIEWTKRRAYELANSDVEVFKTKFKTILFI